MGWGGVRPERLERGGPYWQLKLRWMGTERVQMKGVLPWLVRLFVRHVVLVQEVLLRLGCTSRPNTTFIFLTVHYFNAFVSHRPAGWAGSRAGSPVSYSMCLWLRPSETTSKQKVWPLPILFPQQLSCFLIRSTVIKWRNEYWTARPSPLLLNILRSFTTARSLQTSSTTSLQGCSLIRLQFWATIISYTATKNPIYVQWAHKV